MAGFSIGAAWEEMIAFVRRESAILVPVAMATFGVGAIFISIALPDEAFTPGKPMHFDARTWLLLPAFLLILLGNVATAAIVLLPGMTVGEALRRSLAKMPIVVGVIAITGAALLFVMIIFGMILTPLTANSVQAAALLAPIVFAMLTMISVPMLLLAPVIAIEPLNPIATLRRLARLTKGNAGRLFAILCALLLINMTVSIIATVVIGALTKLAALTVGLPELITLIGDIVMAAISAGLAMAIGVYLAFVYRRIVG